MAVKEVKEITAAQAASILKTDPHTVRWWCRLGRLKGRKVAGAVWLIELQSVKQFRRLPPGPAPGGRKRDVKRC